MMDAKEAAAKAADAFVMACGDTRGYFEDVVVHALRARDAEHEAERKRLAARERELVEALTKLVEGVDAATDGLNNCCVIAAIHGVPFNGPSYGVVLQEARAAIAAPQTEKEQPA